LVIIDRRRRLPVSPGEGDLSVPTRWLEDAERAPVAVAPEPHRPRRVSEPVGVDSDEVWM
ncbi:MAG TPA: hypothetical protein VLL25_09890, partial [Acidimicrobiales bacterium]|nr:hypothetical protein [Acidimicrobiales bacterium]